MNPETRWRPARIATPSTRFTTAARCAPDPIGARIRDEEIARLRSAPGDERFEAACRSGRAAPLRRSVAIYSATDRFMARVGQTEPDTQNVPRISSHNFRT